MTNRTKYNKRSKTEIVNAFGGKCQICSYDKSIGALHFHHTDKKLKRHNPSDLIHSRGAKVAIQILIEEKCILICSNCHSELHELKGNFDKFELKPPIKHNCKFCLSDFFSLREDAKYCSEKCSQLSQRKCERPNEEQLKQLIKEYGYSRVGKMFNVSDNAVRKWAKKYALVV